MPDEVLYRLDAWFGHWYLDYDVLGELAVLAPLVDGGLGFNHMKTLKMYESRIKTNEGPYRHERLYIARTGKQEAAVLARGRTGVGMLESNTRTG